MGRLLARLAATLALCASAFAAHAQSSCSIPGGDGPSTLSSYPNAIYIPSGTASAGSTSLSLASRRTTGGAPADDIRAGDLLLIVQAQDASFDSSNTSSYGGTSTGSGYTSLGNAGYYEYVTVSASLVGTISGAGTVPLASPLLNTYYQSGATGSSGQRRYQVLRVPQYSTVTLSGTITAPVWDGFSGGIIALEAAGALNWGGATLDASARGFRGGGGQCSNANGTGTAMTWQEYRNSFGTGAVNLAGTGNVPNGAKGEGVAGAPILVFIPTTPNNGNAAGTVRWMCSTGETGTACPTQDGSTAGYPGGSFGRGAPGNGGGGSTDGNPTANDQNTGGAGGGNYSAGGHGGYGWTPGTPPGQDGGGFGGAAVPGSPSRIFFGGGGGSATSNNCTGTPGFGAAGSGASGGGIVFVRVGSVSGSGTINVQGGSANSTLGNDASGGGGAGGTALVFVNNSGGATGATINASGGNGGSNTGGGAPHGPGGGGSGGFVVLSGSASFNVNGGIGGTTATSPTSTFDYGATASAGGVQYVGLTASQIPGAGASPACYPQITVTKTTSTPNVAQGGIATWTITATNAAGRGTARTARLTDVLPATPNFTFAATNNILLGGGATRPVILDPTAAATTPIWGDFDIPGGGTVSIDFNVNVLAATPPATYQNPATIDYLDPTRTGGATRVTPGGAHQSGGTIAAGSNYVATSTTNEDVTVRAPVALAKSFAPTSITDNGVTTLTILFTNPNATALANAAITDNYPAGMENAAVPAANTTCGGTVTAVAGASTFTLANATIPASPATCQVTVNVTATVAQAYTNTLPPGALTDTQNVSNANASATLLARPRVTKSFAPIAVPANTDSTLTISIVNPNAATALTGVQLTDAFPAGLVATSGTVTYGPGCTTFTNAAFGAGASTFTITGGTIAGGATCAVSFAVRAAANGSYANTTSGATSTQTPQAGNASNTANLGVGVVNISKAFAPATIRTGQTSTITFTLVNPTNVVQTSAAFADSLVNMSVANAAVGGTCVGTTPATLSLGATSLSFSGITVPAGVPTGSCTVTVVVTSSTVGTQNNTSSGVSTALLPQGPTSNTAPLTVIGPPSITKSFSPSAIGPGTNSTLTFTLNNPNSVALTGLNFTDTYPLAPGALVNATPIVIGGSCTGVTSTAVAGGGTFNVSVGNFPAGSACTITVPVTATVPGTYNNTTSAVTTAEAAASAPSNTAQLTVLAAPTIAKSFTPATIGAGGTSTVTFTLTNPNASALTNARFTDTFTNMSIGAAGVGGTCGGVFGVPTPAIGDAFVDLRVPTLGPGVSCTVTVAVTSSTVGVQPNVASGVTTTETPTAGAASNSATLTVLATPTIAKSFAPGQIQTGGTSTITFTLANPNASALNLVTFTDTLANMTVASTTTGGTCTGVTFPVTALTVGGTVIAPRLASLAGGASCTLTVQVTSSVVSPAAGHVNTTTGVSSTETTTPGATASANLKVLGAPTIVKSFSPSTVAANNPTTMTFTITNPNPVPLTGGLFTDTFPVGLAIRNVTQSFVGAGRGTCPAAIPAGMVAGSPPPTAPTFTMNAVQVPANSSCTITIDMVATASGTYNNTTSGMTTTQTPTAGPASNTAVLQVNQGPTLAKTFVTNPIPVGTNTIMRFTVTNPNASVALTNVAFTDALTNMTVNSATMAGTSTCTGVTFSPALSVGGTAVNPTLASLAGGASCTIDITVTSTVVSPSTGHVNTTGAPTSFESPSGNTAASAVLYVAAPPTVTKNFAPGGVVNNTTNGTVTLVLTNPNPSALTAVTITDVFPAGMAARVTGAAPTLTGCGAGTLTDSGGGALGDLDVGVRLNGATIAANGTCTITFAVRAAVGTYTNTTSLFTGQYTGGALPAITLTGNNASDNFAVGQATISKAFGAATLAVNGTTTLTLTVINNSGGNFTGTLNFLDTFPAGLVVHTTPGFANTCGGAVNSGNTSGNTSVQITGGTVNNAATCTVTVTVRATASGTLSNTVTATAPAAINGRTDTAVLTVLDPPTVTKSFSPSTLNAAGNSTLTITLGNTNAVAITGAAFTDLYPAAPGQMTVANTTVVNTCGGTIDENDAADGDNTYEVNDRSVRLTGGTIPPGGCTITVTVAVPATPGSYTNTIAVGGLTSTNAGASTVPGSAVLTVTGATLTKTFSPASVGLGTNATVVFTISKTAAVATQSGLGFTDTLPSGLTVAATPNILTNCPAGGAFAAPGFSVTAAGSSIAVTGASINVGVATCQVQVNVTPTQAITTCPVAANTNGAANISALAGGIQNGVISQCLSVTTAIPAFTKAFSPTTIATGGIANLIFTVTQPAGNGTQTFSFNDTLPAGLVIQSATVTGSCTGGSVTAPAGGNTITVSGRQISGTTCDIIVPVTTAPAPTVGACPGTPPNTNGAAQISGASNVTSSVTDQCLTVTAAPPSLAKAFSPASIPQGGVSTLTFTVTNGAGNPAQASFGFTDTFPLGLVVAGVPNTSTTCGSASITANAGAGLVTIAGASLALGQASCIVRVDVTAAAANTYTNATANIGAVTGGLDTTGISVPLTVYASAALTKVFNPLAIAPGQVSLLTFTITNGAGNPAQAGLAFTDVLPSNVVVAPAPNVQTNCPAGAGFGAPGGGMTVGASAGGGSISVAGAAINAGVASCQVRVNVTSATAGTYPNTSANVNGLAGGLTAGGVSSTLSVSTASLGKAFNPLSIGAGGVSQLTFTVTNGAGNPAQSGLAFTDNLPSGLVVATPNGLVNGCGGSVTAVAASTSVALSAGTLASAAASCTIQVNVTAASPAAYSNTSGNITGSAGLDVSGVNATLTVTRATLTKSFTGANLAIGGTTTIAFTITNSAGNPAQSGIGFTDTLPAGLAVSGAGSAQTNCPAGGALGAIPGGMTVTAGGSSIVVSGAALNLTVASCEVRVTITPSATPTVGACPQANNTNGLANVSALANVINGVTSQCIPVFAAPQVAKAFGASDIALNGTTTLTLTITNPAGNAGALTGLAVSDAFPAGLQVAATPGLANTCGGTVSPGATAGDTTLTLAGGASLAAGASCQVQVNVTATTVGAKNNTTGNVSATGPVAITGNTASATLTVSAPPTVTKSFNPTSIAAGGTSVLSLTVTNPAGNPAAITTVQLPDTFPAGVTLANTTFTFTPAACGTATRTTGAASVAGDNNIRLNVATLAAGSSCQLQANVTSSTVGAANNTTTAVTAAGPAALTGGTASATLTVLAAPTVTKSFGTASLASGGNTSLTVTIGNTNAAAITLTSAFTDTFPAGMTIGTAGNTGTCAGVTATAGAASFSVASATSIPAGGCTVIVNVTTSTPGAATNTIAIGDLQTSAGPNAAAASATLNVFGVPTVAKSFNPTSIASGGTSVLSLTVTNPAANPAAITTVQLPDTFPAGVTLSNIAFTFTPLACGTATRTTGAASVAGDNNVRLNVATLAAGASCQLQANVTSSTVGAAINTTTAVTAAGPAALTGGTANATLTVLAAPTLAKSFGAASIASGGNIGLTVTIGNTNASAITLTSALTDTFPAGMTIGTAGNTGTCTGVTATAGANNFSVANATSIPAGGCTVIVNVTTSTPGAAINTLAAGSLQTSAGNNAAPATATLNVFGVPTIAKSFNPTSIAAGGTSVLSLTVTNPAANPAAITTVQLPDTFPAGVTLANITFTFTPLACGTATRTTGVASVAGDNNVRLNVASLAAGSSCQLQANVTSSTVGVASNTTTAVTATGPVALTGGTANATLTVLAAPTVTKAFGTTNLASGGNTSLTVTIGNTNAAAITLTAALTDTFPAGMTIGTAGNTGTCTGVTANAGANNFSIANATSIPAGGCTVIVNVTTSTPGASTNTIAAGSLQTSAGNNAAPASATLNVFGAPTVAKSFNPTSIAAGGTSVLSLTVTNPAANPAAVTTIQLPDTFPAGVTLANTTFTFTPLACGTATTTAGAASAAGDNNVRLNVATLAANASCQLQANVTSSTVGAASNTTTVVTATGPVALTGGTANATLTVLAAPTVAKVFGVAGIASGGNTSLTVTIGNTNAAAITLSAALTDTFPGGMTIGTAGNTGTCTGVTATAGANNFSIANATSIPAGGCTVIVNVTSSTPGAATNTIAAGALQTSAGNNAAPASATLNVFGAPTVAKTFNPTSIAAGGTSVLSLTVTNPAANPAAITTVQLPDTFPAGVTLSNIVFTFTPLACGTATRTTGAASVAGDNNIRLNVATLAAGASCQLQATVTSSTVGAASNTTTAVTATGPVALTGGTATATLTVLAAPTVTKSFGTASLASGGNTSLTVTIANTNAAAITLSSALTDNFPAGMTIGTAGNTGTCTGVTATAGANNFSIASATSIPAGGCTVIVNVTSSTPGAATNTIAAGDLQTSAGNNPAPASATLNVFGAPTVAKSFNPTSIAAGGTSVLSLTVTNPASNPAAITTVQLPDTFPAGVTLSNIAFTFTPLACGTATRTTGAASVAGDNNVRLNVASLAAGASCQLQANVTSSTVGVANNTTTAVTAAGPAALTGGTASATLTVLAAPTLAKSFGVASLASGGNTSLTVTIGNTNAAAITLSSALTDTFPGGMTIGTAGNTGTCTGVTATAGAGSFTVANATSIPSGGCTVIVNVTSSTPGASTNTIAAGSLQTSAGNNAAPASATLNVFGAPTVAKSFNPTSIAAGGTSVLSLTVTNPGANPAALTTIQLPDTFPAGVTLSNVVFTFTPAACGTATTTTGAASASGDNNVRLNVATLAAGASCQLQANVTSSTVGVASNTTTAVTATGPVALTGGTANATLTVLSAPTLAKSFGVASIASGANTSLTVTIGNTNGAAVTLTSAFTDTFPAGMTIGTAGNTGTCTGVTATAGANNFTIANATSIPAGGCTVIVNVTSSTPGASTNTIAAGSLQTSAGNNAAPASATLNVFGVPTVAKSFNPTSIAAGGTSVLSLTVTNPAGNPAAITTVQLPDTFPAGVTLSNTTFTFTPLACGTATRTTGVASAAGDNNIRLNVATLGIGASCQLQANVTSSTVGAASNTTTAVTAAGPAALTGGTANAILTVLTGPTVTKAFGAAGIASGGNTSLTVTIGNTNAAAITLSSALTDNFPAGMTIGTAGNTGTCAGVTATAGAASFSIANATSIPAGGCTVIVNVTSSTPGAATNTIAIGDLQTSAGPNAAPASATLNVFGAPTVAKSFNPTSIAAGGTSVLSLTVTNPAGNPAAITTVQLPDTFPAGVTLANITFTFTPAACGTATRTTGAASAAGDNNVRLNVASLAAGASCQLQANVTSSTVGTVANTTTAVTAAGPVALTGGTATANLTVLAGPVLGKSFGTGSLASGGNTSLTVTLGNGNAGAITLTAALTDTFPAGMTLAAGGSTGTCAGVTATAGTGSFTVASGTSIPAGGCTVIVSVTSSTPGAATNTLAAGSLQTSAGNNAAPATATLNVFGAPTVAKSFSPTSIAAGGTSVLSLTVTNPAANPAAITTVQLPDTFPAGVTLSNIAFTFTPLACGTATRTTGAASVAGDNNIRLNVATLAAGASCQLQATVTSSTVGAASNTTTAVTATGPVALTGGTASATLTVLAGPTVTKSFGAADIASGGNTSLTVTIGNTNGAAITLTSAFTDTFPAGMTIGTAGNTGTCTGVTATAGAGSFTVANATSIPAGGCTVIVNVTSSTPGASTNTIAAGNLQTSAGNNAAPASATLNVFAAPTVAKSFNPTSIAAGGTSVLSLTVTNPGANPAAITTVQLPDTFPAGVTLSNIAFTFTPLACGTATRTTGAASVAGDNNVRLNVATLAPGGSCQLQATVTSSTVGAASNTTSAVTATGPVALTGGTATATLTVLSGPTLAKAFGATDIASGGNTSLTVTIGNANAGAITLASAFTDTFPAGMTINTAGNTGTCTGVTATAGANNFSIANATSIPAGGCTVIVNVTSSTPGAAVNTLAAGSLQTSAGNNAAPATATLNVYGAPTVTKTFNPTSIAAGGTSVLSLTVTNPGANPAAITGVQLPDTFPAGVTLSNIAFTFTPAACGTATRTTGAASVAGDNNVRLNVATLAAGASCQLQANVTSSTVGVASNTTTAVTAAGPAALTGGTATATLTVLAGPTLAKSFAVASLAAGGNTDLTVTLGNANAGAITLTAALTDTFPAGMTINTAGNTGTCTGVTATAGAGSFTVANATSIPSGGCTVIVNVTSSTPGAATNTLAAGSLQTSAGNNAAPASATLNVFGAPTVTKTFNPTTIAAGGTSVLALTVTNPAANPAAITTVQLPDTFPAGVTLANVTFTFTPAACGTATRTTGAASVAGDNNVRLNVASLAAGASCQLQANVTSSTIGAASNTTTAVTATGPVALTGGTATATLTVQSAPTLAKSFSPAGIASGGSSTLTVTIGNTNAGAITLTAALTDTFPAGMTIGTAGNTGTCTGVTATAGANNFSVANATSIPAGGCTVIVNVTSSTPGAAVNTLAAGSLQTSAGNNAAPATATLNVFGAPTIAKSFASPIGPNGVSQLTFTVTNPAANPAPLTGVAFTDTFPTTPGAMVVAATTGASTTGCGAPTFAPVAGAASIAFSGGTIATGTPCTVTVNVTAPTVGTYNNTSSAVSATGPVALSGGTASASLVVAQSSLDKAFAPTTIAAGGTSTLTFTIANAAGNAAQSGIGFTDNLPGNVRVAAVPNVTTNCPAGAGFAAPGFAVTAAAGSATITVANAAMNAAVASCQVRVDVTANIGGAYTNDATRIAGTANITNAVTPGTLTVTTATPTVTKSFNPATVNANAVSQLTITLTNANSTAATLSAALTDTLPVPVVVATPANASTDCAGAGALVATAGTGAITLPAGRQIPAGSGTTAGSCTITVDVRSASGGVFTNTIAAGALQTSNGNNAAPASAVLTVNAAAPSIAKSFTPPAIAADGTSTVTLTISNPNAFALTGAGFGDTLANMTISGNQNAAGSCAGANTNALTAGQTAVAISGLTIPAAVGVTPGSCTVTFVVTSDVPGVNNNATTGVASANAPTGAVSNTATLTVTAAAPTIVKSFTPASIAYGATSTVTLTIANTNGGALTGAGFTDTLANMSISGAQTALGTCVGANGNNLTAGQTAVAISGLTIPANSSCTVTFIVTSTTPGVNPNATSGVASAQAPTGAVSNTVNLTVTATAPTIGKTFTPATVISGQASTLRVSITNPNAAAITGVALTDTFPVAPGAGLVRAPTPNASAGVSCGAATVNTTAGSVSISNATIAAGATCTFQVDVVAGNAGVYVNTIAAGALASSAGSNTAPASATLTVTGVADVAVVKSAPATVVTGNAISYTITITNAGPDTAHGTTFSDNVPAQVTGVTGGCVAAGGAACGTVNVAGNNVTSTITALPVGGTITITIGGTVGGVGALANTATVAPPAGTTDPANGNNSSTANTTILAPDLTIAKTHAGNFTVGTNGVYTIAVGNGGTAATSGTVTVTDSLPAGLGFVSATGAGWTCGFVAPTVTCTSAAVIAVAGNAPPITLTVSVASTAVPSVLNFASVAGGGEPAALNGNNQSGDNTIVTSPGVNTFVPDGAQTGMPGTVVFYPHSFTAATAGSVAFTTTNVPSPVVPGWTQLVYLDSDCSGTLSTAEGVTPLTAAVAINAGETICIVVKDNIPPMAPYNARNVITVTSTFNGASTIARTDTTTVGALAGAGLTLAKAVRNVTQGGASGTSNQARPNDVLEYTITYTNTSTSSVSAIVVTDATPAFTTYLAAACTAPLPASLTGCTVTAQPAVNGSGSVVWTLAGSLNSGGSGSVTYTVRVEP